MKIFKIISESLVEDTFYPKIEVILVYRSAIVRFIEWSSRSPVQTGSRQRTEGRSKKGVGRSVAGVRSAVWALTVHRIPQNVRLFEVKFSPSCSPSRAPTDFPSFHPFGHLCPDTRPGDYTCGKGGEQKFVIHARNRSCSSIVKVGWTKMISRFREKWRPVETRITNEAIESFCARNTWVGKSKKGEEY